ncbi:type I methionyl aminopeptidase [Shinella daejeonensis]|uniref:type I methionyl aminopeptidase n=1 Tax=Shinella daejeonensis TaxID=659017 RepID=UPI0020C7F2BF|nr:type I methionyl aminopeptidase [Shinella daejeonensis]MCP8894046.1 type I methionyl aminopeptidase [Shinella daejeonensis]
MTLGNDDDLQGMKAIGRICANVLQHMASAMRPGMTTAELDLIGRRMMEAAGARSAPEQCYGFPGATCISVNEEVAHGIPGDRVIREGDLVNIDVSAELDGYFADTGASFVVGRATPAVERLCRDGKRAMWVGLKEVRTGRPLAGIGNAIGAFARKNRYTLITNLASHGVGRSLHEDPSEVPTWPDPHEKRHMNEGLVFTVEPFLSLGGQWADNGEADEWTLYSEPKAPTVQFEHTVAVTRDGPLILTLPG